VGTGKKTPEAILSGQRIREVCRAAGIDLKELARRSRIGYSTLSNYRQGLREVPIRAAQRIQKVTGVPAAYVLGVISESDMELLEAPPGVRAALLEAIRQFHAATRPPGLPVPAPHSVNPAIRDS
jgi:transcriptional regulator with XRE-family HTH domain